MIASYIYDDQDGSVSLTTGQLVSGSRGGQNYYYHFNSHGDVTKITDSTGSVVASYEYDAWGNITSSSGSFASSQPFRYAGYLYDPETGLYYLINRYYDPGIGRFISRDPGFSSPPDSLGGNPYLYVRNNPVNRTDPDGLGPTGTLFGRVMNTAGSPIVGAAVRYGNIAISGGNYILPGNANVMGTNAAGEYRFTLETGIYNLYYDAVGYASQKQEYHAVWPGQETVAPTVIMSPVVYASAPQPAPAPAPAQPAPTQPAPPQPLPPSPSQTLSRYREKTFIFSVGYIKLAAYAEFLLYGGGTRANLSVVAYPRLLENYGYYVNAEVYTANKTFFMFRTTPPEAYIIEPGGKLFEFTKWVSLNYGRPKYVRILLDVLYQGPKGVWTSFLESYRYMVITPQ